MMKRKSLKQNASVPCLLQGILFFFLAVTSVIVADPAVGLTVKKEGERHTYTIIGIDIQNLKTGTIICKYNAAADIDKAVIGALKSSVALGVSVDRLNNLMNISFSSTGVLSIDSSAIILIKVSTTNNINGPVVNLQSAAFIDKQGVSQNAKLLDITKVVHHGTKKELGGKPAYYTNYLLNGQLLNENMVTDLKKSCRYFIPRQIVHR